MKGEQIYRQSVLTQKPRTLFDPSNKAHMLDFAYYIKYSNWRNGCGYLLEDPYTDIPTMIRSKIVDNVLSVYLEKI